MVKRQIAGTASEEWVTGNPGRYARLAVLHGEGIREMSRDEVTVP